MGLPAFEECDVKHHQNGYIVYDKLKIVQKRKHSNLKIVHFYWTKNRFVLKFESCFGNRKFKRKRARKEC